MDNVSVRRHRVGDIGLMSAENFVNLIKERYQKVFLNLEAKLKLSSHSNTPKKIKDIARLSKKISKIMKKSSRMKSDW